MGIIGWDEEPLAEFLKALDDADFDLDLTGIEQTEVDHLLALLSGDEEEPQEPMTHPGDLWVLGRHLLVCGDSTDAATVAPLLEAFIKAMSAAEAVIYEPFAGSGTTIIAAERQRRRCFAIELDPGYCDVIVRRWEKYTGLKAVLET